MQFKQSKHLGIEMRNLEWTQPEEVLTHLGESIDTLVESRATEPMMRNGLKYIKRKIENTDWRSTR